MGIRKLLGREGALAGARRELLEGLPPGTTGVEVGVWKGDFSAQILKIAKPAVLHLVDPWQFQPEFSKSWFGGGEARSQADMDAIHQSVADRFAAQIAEGRVVLHRAPSAAAAADFAPASLDWVYIDGTTSTSTSGTTWRPTSRSSAPVGWSWATTTPRVAGSRAA
jgi:hypothetical protein